MESGGAKQQNNNSQDRSQQQQQPQPPAQKCPRCDSVNTKFCYYNNYSLSQPRYFCKTCRRYWTQGGTLRNVPVGGGCRKGKRAKTSSSSSATSSSSSASPSPSPSSITAATTTPSSAGHHQHHHQFMASPNFPHHQSQYMMMGNNNNPGGLGLGTGTGTGTTSFYPGTAGFLNSLSAIQALNTNHPEAVPNQGLMGGSASSSNLGLMQGFGGAASFAFFENSHNINPRQEENLMMSFPNSSHQLPSWQRRAAEEEEGYDVAGASVAAGGSVPDTALWSISTTATTTAGGENVHGKSDKSSTAGGGGGGGSGSSRQDNVDRRWNHGGGGGGGGGQVPGYGPSS